MAKYAYIGGMGSGHGHAGTHLHVPPAHADRRLLAAALALIVGYMSGEVVVGLAAHSLALLSDAAHMLTDAAALGLALVAMRLARQPPRGGYTYGLHRAEILSAQANGVTLLVLAGWLAVEATGRLLHPPRVAGAAVLATALVGVAVNLAASALIRRADRTSLNIRGAYRHIVTDLAAFAGTAVAAVVILATGWMRADAVVSLLVAALMVAAAVTLLRDSGRILLEAAPAGVRPAEVGAALAAVAGVREVHDLHVWVITSGRPALSAHVLVAPEHDCHATRRELERVLAGGWAIRHTTLQVDHAGPELLRVDGDGTAGAAHCAQAHGTPYHPAS